MQEINKTLNQLSGHLEIIAVPLFNVIAVEGPILNIANDDFNYQLKCSTESIKYSAPTNKSKPGNSFRHSISGDIVGRSSENDKLLETMLRYRYIIVLKNWDGKYTRIGDPNQGLQFDFKYSTSPNPSGDKGYSIEFSGNTLSSQKPVNFPFTIK